jgi:cytochrome c551/c552
MRARPQYPATSRACLAYTLLHCHTPAQQPHGPPPYLVAQDAADTSKASAELAAFLRPAAAAAAAAAAMRQQQQQRLSSLAKTALCSCSQLGVPTTRQADDGCVV